MKLFLSLLLAAASAYAADGVAATPPMGWNSWDCYGTTVTEAEVKANADYMARTSSRTAGSTWWWTSSGPSRTPRRTATGPDAELAMDDTAG